VFKVQPVVNPLKFTLTIPMLLKLPFAHLEIILTYNTGREIGLFQKMMHEAAFDCFVATLDQTSTCACGYCPSNKP
jgi:hypothetical protein